MIGFQGEYKIWSIAGESLDGDYLERGERLGMTRRLKEIVFQWRLWE